MRHETQRVSPWIHTGTGISLALKREEIFDTVQWMASAFLMAAIVRDCNLKPNKIYKGSVLNTEMIWELWDDWCKISLSKMDENHENSWKPVGCQKDVFIYQC